LDQLFGRIRIGIRIVLSFIQAISVAPLQVLYYSEVLPTQHGYCAEISRQSDTGNCEWRTCPRSRPYVMARAGVKPMSLRMKDIDSTKAPTRPTNSVQIVLYCFNWKHITGPFSAISDYPLCSLDHNDLLIPPPRRATL